MLNALKKKAFVPDTVSGPAESPGDAYANARREWNERYGSYVTRAKVWRLFAFVMAVTTAVLGVAFMAGTLPADDPGDEHQPARPGIRDRHPAPFPLLGSANHGEQPRRPGRPVPGLGLVVVGPGQFVAVAGSRLSSCDEHYTAPRSAAGSSSPSSRRTLAGLLCSSVVSGIRSRVFSTVQSSAHTSPRNWSATCRIMVPYRRR